ncbi:MAG: carbamoyl phosphate synthase small subunit, partial [Candidatus Levybacteria bacterium]|nr:carbamoyl phosphate synthase small subunit [Candidatus Levybacteria bacterium]
IKDTRFLAQKIREKGTMLGKIILNEENVDFYDPNKQNLVAEVSTKRLNLVQGSTLTNKTVLLIDCGAKRNIQRCLIKRGIKVITAPWNFNPFNQSSGKVKFDAIVISNGPGDPKMADKTIENVKKALEKKIPVLGICLGNQILALAAEGDTYKLKFGHRSQNQPCIMNDTKRCYITVQNHGFAVGKIPQGFRPWFTNANDGTNEGIIHEKLPFMSVQFHPEANPGPSDTEWIFDYFLDKIKNHNS